MLNVIVLDLVQWQPPDGGRLALGFAVGTHVNYILRG